MPSNLLIDIQAANQTGINPGKTFNLGLGPSFSCSSLQIQPVPVSAEPQAGGPAQPPASKQSFSVCVPALSLAEWGLDPPAAVLCCACALPTVSVLPQSKDH